MKTSSIKKIKIFKKKQFIKNLFDFSIKIKLILNDTES